MRVILEVTDSVGTTSNFKYDLPEEYIEGEEFNRVLPQGDNFRFYSAGYIYRLTECGWEEFDDPSEEVIERILSEIKK